MSVTFPTTARVGYRDYRIESWPTMAASGEGCLGQTCNVTGTIKVNQALIAEQPVKAANTLIHELLHACWFVGGLKDDDDQERNVTVLANQLTQLWRDNPPVIAYLAENLK